MSRLFDITRTPKRRRPGLTSLIDVVFILLLFFMLATRFTAEGRMELSTGRLGDGAAADRSTALLRVAPDGIDLGGRPIETAALEAALADIAERNAALVIEPRDGASLQRLVDILDLVEAAGISRATVAGR